MKSPLLMFLEGRFIDTLKIVQQMIFRNVSFQTVVQFWRENEKRQLWLKLQSLSTDPYTLMGAPFKLCLPLLVGVSLWTSNRSFQ